MFRSIVLLVGGLASVWTVSSLAQDAVLTQEYGSGVHAYFTSDWQQAYERLTAAVEGGTKDPRVFYFRGLTYLRLGRPQDAGMDFRVGADKESKDINRFYNVGRALERVQGWERVELEKYRVAARMAAFQQEENMRKARYETMKREEERVLREQSLAAPEVPPGGPEVMPPPEAESENPFAAPEAPAAKKGAAAKSAAKKGADDNPFAAPKSEANDKGAAAPKKAAAEKKSGDEDDPFGGSGDEKKTPDAKKKPNGNSGKTPDKEADPFGN